MAKQGKQAIIDKHDKLFKKALETLANRKAFMKLSLPEKLQTVIDFNKLEVDDTRYVDDRFKNAFSDHVVKTRMKKKSVPGSGIQEYYEADIYILFEHKSFRDGAVLVQLLIYMCLMWQIDIAEGKPLRVIIPLVFYHGMEEWNVPLQFNRQFDVSDEVKEYLLGFKYVLFDTKDWNFNDERNSPLKDHVFLLTSITLMKSAFNRDLDAVREIFRFWREKGFLKNRDKVFFFLAYITESIGLSYEDVTKLLNQGKINGGEIMRTWLDDVRDETREAVKVEVREEVKIEVKEEVKEEVKIETAKAFLENGVDIDTVIKSTGFSREEIEKLAQSIHKTEAGA
ncbi:MAG: Rpn family recombination-promoting nuclease/putative transposase [bacterium]|nr:Rpn family recombination-promoting nuclease/putative transposase [bacterium]